MNIVSLVANLQKECDYYRESLREAQGVIKQLTEGPGEIEYIHPFDVADKLNDSVPDHVDYIDIIPESGNFITIDGKKYKQSVFIPAKSKRFR